MLSQRMIRISLILILILMIGLMPLSSLNAKTMTYTGDPPIYNWNDNWKYNQSIDPHIKTNSISSIYQPIDIQIKFLNNCWAVNESVNSIRVLSWDGNIWHELESQIYNLNFTDDYHISSCGIVFLIPDFANGEESYYIYYNDQETSASNYIDHLSVKDAYYYFEPISGISVEGDYYEISEDGFIVYGVGQKGQVMNRKLSQIAIRLKPNTEVFDILNSDLLTSFCFSYQNGPDDDDEIASDHRLIAKEILIDGNLMVEFLVISGSENGQLKTSNIYKYYYNPSEDKRINVHVKHEVLAECIVKGIENSDGRFGTIVSYNSKSASMKKILSCWVRASSSRITVFVRRCSRFWGVPALTRVSISPKWIAPQKLVQY